MSQKIQFIATVVHRPKLIILDEPFSGLDPINSNLIKDEIINLKNQGSSILFSTHRMEQVEEMCEEIVLINKFEIITSEKISDSIIQKYNLVEFAPLNYSFQIQDLSIIKSRTRELLQEDISLRSFKELLPTFNQFFIQIVNQSNHE